MHTYPPFEPSASSPQLVCIAEDDGGVLGYLVVDTFVDGRSHGGVRMRLDVTAEEVSLLARTMTMKYRLLGLPFGGAKAGVLGDPDAPLEQRRARLARFGRAIAPLLQKELFVPAADMGTDLEDIRYMLREAGVTFQRRRLPPVSSGTYTAHSVFASLREMARFQCMDLVGLSVAVEGFGEVGSVLAGLLAEAGAKVVAISTSEGAAYAPDGLDVAALLDLYPEFGSRVVTHLSHGKRIDTSRIPTLPVDALCPCATIHAIHKGNAPEVQARLLCAGANNPWTPGAEAVLQESGVLLLPEFVTNTGGILGTFMAYACFSHAEIVRFVEEHFTHSIRGLLDQAHNQGSTPRTAAERFLAERRMPEGAWSEMNLRGWAFRTGIAMHRRGLVPGGLVRAITRPLLHRMLRLEPES